MILSKNRHSASLLSYLTFNRHMQISIQTEKVTCREVAWRTTIGCFKFLHIKKNQLSYCPLLTEISPIMAYIEACFKENADGQSYRIHVSGFTHKHLAMLLTPQKCFHFMHQVYLCIYILLHVSV